jgi:hypothetical protein
MIGGILVLFIYIERLASNEIFSLPNKMHRKVGRAKAYQHPGSVAERITSRESQYCRYNLKTTFRHPTEELKIRDKTYKQWELEYNRDIDEYQSDLSYIFRSTRSTLSDHKRN